jgi:hypothetical protein
MCGSSPLRVVSHLPNIATLCRGTHFSMVMAPKTTRSEWGPVARSASNCLGQHVLFHRICLNPHFFSLDLYTFRGERRIVKMSTLCTLVIMMKKKIFCDFCRSGRLVLLLFMCRLPPDISVENWFQQRTHPPATSGRESVLWKSPMPVYLTWCCVSMCGRSS